MARLAAIQAIYQQKITGMDAGDVVVQFKQHHFNKSMDDIDLGSLDRELFNDLVMGANTRLTDIDGIIQSNLAEGWSIERLDIVLLSILRCAIYELWCRTDIPVKVTIDEYVNLTADFYDQKEPNFVNGLLDKVAKALRGGDPVAVVK